MRGIHAKFPLKIKDFEYLAQTAKQFSELATFTRKRVLKRKGKWQFMIFTKQPFIGVYKVYKNGKVTEFR